MLKILRMEQSRLNERLNALIGLIITIGIMVLWMAALLFWGILA